MERPGSVLDGGEAGGDSSQDHGGRRAVARILQGAFLFAQAPKLGIPGAELVHDSLVTVLLSRNVKCMAETAEDVGGRVSLLKVSRAATTLGG